MRREGKEIQKAGETLLSKWLAANDLEMTTSVLDKLCSLHGFSVHESLFKAIGEKTVILGDRDLDEIRGKKKFESTIVSGGWRRYVPFLKSMIRRQQIRCSQTILQQKD